MPRYDRYAPLYSQAERFRDLCLIQDRSLLWPDKSLWTPEHVLDLKSRIIDSPELGSDRSFEEKISLQLQDAPPELWGILADTYFLYFLPSDSMTIRKKRGDLEWAAQNAGYSLPSSDDPVWEAQDAGFTRTAIRYHFKVLQFTLIFRLALHVKRQENRAAAFGDPAALQDLLDRILEEDTPHAERAYDMRHALLFMLFPDQYERIISTRDKDDIIKTYRDRVDEPLPQDRDRALRVIRETRSAEYEAAPGEPFDFYNHARDEWRSLSKVKAGDVTSRVEEPQAGEPAADELLAIERQIYRTLKRTRNLIMYGPPGTGKTYLANRIADKLIEEQLQAGLTPAASAQRVIENLTLYDILALIMYESGSGAEFQVPELRDHRLIEARFISYPVKFPAESLWNNLQSHTSMDCPNVKVTRRYEPFLFWKSDEGKWSLMSEGREYVENKLAEQLLLLRPEEGNQLNSEDFVRITTFHQSYSYEDFIEGLRPVPSVNEPGQISYEIVKGVFRQISDRAAADPDNIYVLIIDEINRGNIAKILGELITLLEDDKRAGNRNALTVTLPYSQDPFSVPANLFVIGTMNTADRSIALLDVALRRRFAFAEIMPDPSLLAGATVDIPEGSLDLERLLTVLNRAISHMVSRDHQIGHSYFLKIKSTEPEDRLEVLEFVWNNQILPLLEEYFYSQRESLAELLKSFRTPEDDERDPEKLELGRLYGEDLLTALINFQPE